MSLYQPAPPIPSVSVHEAAHRRPGAVLVDVREPHEWQAGHAPDAVHVPLGRVPDALPHGSVLYLVCRSGNRSGHAVAALHRAGYDVVNVDGGMSAWEAAGLPVVRTDGGPGTVV
jgi:rhodanese-related sulfurtransferase